MKKAVLFIAVLMVFSGVCAHAALVEEMDTGKALEKLGRGATNLVTSPGEFINQIPPAMEQSPDYVTGSVVALGRGLGYMLRRAGAGLYDLATFPFPGKTNYEPIMQPETIITQVGDTTIS